MVSHRSKQNGHQVPLKGTYFLDQEKTYPKEFCDVLTHYSTLFPVSPNQNCQPGGFGGPIQSLNSYSTRQMLSAHLLLLWTDGLRCALWTERKLRDFNLADTAVWINYHYRKLFCPHCHRVSVVDLGLFHPYLRVSTRLARYVYELCRIMTVYDVASHL